MKRPPEVLPATLWALLKENVLAPVGAFIGAVIVFGAAINDAYDWIRLPLPWQVFFGFGAVLVIGSFAAVLIRLHSRISDLDARSSVADGRSASADQAHSATLDFTLRGMGNLVRHNDGSQNVEEAFAIYAAFEAETDTKYKSDATALANPKLGNDRAWYIFVLFAQPFEAREVHIKDVQPHSEILCSPNRRSQKFMLVRCKGLTIGTRAKLEITRETGLA